MVEVLEPYNRAVKSIKRDLPKILRQILIDDRDKVIRILKDEQLSKGLDSSGKIVGRYSKATEEFANDPFNKPRQDKIAGQPYNFEWSGGLFDDMYMFFEDKDSFSLFSQDEKALFLKGQYGDIFTLTKTNNHRVNMDILRPQMFEKIIQRLFV